ncbi:MAG: YveK family protein [Mediterraneibacter gnavus]
MEEQIKSDEMEIDLVELFHTLVKKAWVILICLLVGAVIAGGYTKLFITPQYQASSTIYVLGNAGQSSNVSVSLSLSKQLTVDFTILSKSRPVMEKVIDKLGLDYSVEQLANMMTVENPTDSSILKVTVTNPDAQLAARYLKRDVRCHC